MKELGRDFASRLPSPRAIPISFSFSILYFGQAAMTSVGQALLFNLTNLNIESPASLKPISSNGYP
jgi:hypothetical protein